MKKSRKDQAREIFQKKSHEPIWDSDDITPQNVIRDTLNWYHANKTDADAAKYLQCDRRYAKSYLTLAWIIRMESRGFKFDTVTREHIRTMKLRLADALGGRTTSLVDDDDSTTSIKSNVINIQERIQKKADEFIGELQGLVDDYGIHGNAKEMNAYQWMIENEVKAAHAAKIIEFYSEFIKEILAAESEKDPTLKEGYSSYSKKRLRNLILCVASIVKDAKTIAENQRATRKPRKKKPVTAAKQVSKLKYKEKDDNLKLQSINPLNIVGCSALWVYNTKTKKLGCYYAMDEAGLGVKGSSITNYSSNSQSKTLRKPAETVKLVLNSGKVALRKILSDLSTKEVSLNGRINKDTILLRTIPN